MTTVYTYELTQGDIRQTIVQRGTETYYYAYDSDGKVIKITDADGNEQSLSFYANGKLNGVSYGVNNNYEVIYNSYLLPNHITADGSPMISYQYNANGDVNGITYANAQYTTLDYTDRMIKKITYRDSNTDTSPDSVNYTRDNHGRTTAVTLQDGTSTVLNYSYNGLDDRNIKGLSITGADNYSGNYTYYLDDIKKRLTDEIHNIAGNSYSVSYTYDDKDRISSVSAGSYEISIEYDDFGRLESTFTSYNGSYVFNYTYQYKYQSANLLEYKIEARNSGCITQFNNPSASYDDQGRIVGLKNDNSTNRSFQYAYDNSGRLLSEQRGYFTPVIYYYDEDGNIDQINTNGAITSYEYVSGKLVSISGEKGLYTFSYDELGNPTEYKGQDFEWTRGRMLSSGSQRGNNFTYKYDANNLRYEKTVNGTRTQYYYNGERLQGEKRGNKVIYYFYGLEGVAGMVYDGAYYFFEKNIVGDVIGIYSSNHTKVASYDYDAWGNILTKSGTLADINPFRYRSYYMDDETGFYYLNTRYYDPEIRRFINADNYELLPELASVIGQVNLYNYCNNNPIMFTDPNGEVIFGIVATLLLGSAIGAFGGVVTAAATGQDLWAAIAAGAFSGLISTIGIGLSVVTGGLGGLAISAVLGLVGGFGGSIIQQGLSNGWETIDYGVAFISGLISAGLNMLTYGITNFAMRNSIGFEEIFDTNLRFGTRLANSLSFSGLSMLATGMFTGPTTLGQSLMDIITYYGNGKAYNGQKATDVTIFYIL